MKVARTFAIAVIALLGLLVLFVLGCMAAFGPRYMARYVFWNTSDIKDYQRFPCHEVHSAPPVFRFSEHRQDSSVSPVFGTAEYTYKGKPQKVGDLENFLESTGTTAFIAIKDDAILYEGYFNGYSRDSINTSFSVAKSFVSALVGIAIDEGYIENVNDPIINYVPELKGRGLDGVTIRHLLMMSSGFIYDDSKLPGDVDFPWGDDVATYYSLNLRETALNVAPEEKPGLHFRYNNYHPLLLGMILERATKKSVAAYLEEKIWQPLGMEYPASWSIDSEESGFEKMESGINARAIDFAKIGRLFLNKGNWNGRQVVSEEWVEESITRDVSVPRDYYSLPGWWSVFFDFENAYYKYMWYGYTRNETSYDFFASGHLGQYIYVCPDKNLIIVRHGMREGNIDWWPELFYNVADKL